MNEAFAPKANPERRLGHEEYITRGSCLGFEEE
jgi:hypothetical protein